MIRLPIKCKALDDLLNGGIERNSITEVFGEAGSGKTNFCLQVSRECANKGKKVAFIDSEGISSERLNQILTNYDAKKILSKILFFNPSSLDDQEKMIKKSINISNVGLIILDTFNLFYRLVWEDDEKSAIRSLNRQITDLQISAMRNDIFVVISGQVYTAENGEIKPFAGRGIEHVAKTIIKFEKIGFGKRQAIIIKHRSQPEGKKVIFSIRHFGLE
jgi:DNA repair protein RadB